MALSLDWGPVGLDQPDFSFWVEIARVHYPVRKAHPPVVTGHIHEYIIQICIHRGSPRAPAVPITPFIIRHDIDTAGKHSSEDVSAK